LLLLFAPKQLRLVSSRLGTRGTGTAECAL
jgi:hypothetical protein